MASRNDGDDRRQMSKMDKAVKKSMEGVKAREVLENLTSVYKMPTIYQREGPLAT